jgi:hypothetical protein
MRRAAPIMAVQREEPPYDRNRRGIPVIGMMPIVIPIFTTKWNRNIPAIPAARLAPNKSFEDAVMINPLTIIKRERKKTNMHPAKPVSSAIIEKIKSVDCWGRYLKWLCVPLRNPLPKTPPEPTAVIDWIMFHPAPRGSIYGSRNTTSLIIWYFFIALMKKRALTWQGERM